MPASELLEAFGPQARELLQSNLLEARRSFSEKGLTRYLEGEPDHRDFFLTPDEQASNDVFLPCCSRSKSACLVLDF